MTNERLPLLCAATIAIVIASAVTPSLDLSCPSGFFAYSIGCSQEEGGVPVPLRKDVYGNGRIFDITHTYRPDMPSWDSVEGLGQDFVKQSASIKNGSLFNSSEMKLGVHSGTHLDAPGHFFDHYFDAGYDVTTLDLEVLNGKCQFQSGGSFLLFLIDFFSHHND